MGDKRKKRRRMRRADKKALLGAGFILLCAILVICCIQIVLRRYINTFDSHRIIQGVSIGNTDVSGLTIKKATERVQEDLNVYAKEKIRLTLDAKRQGEVELGAIGIAVKDLEDTVQQAMDYGKKGNPVQCYKILKKVEKNKNKKNFPVTYEVMPKKAESGLNNAVVAILHAPENASLTISESVVTPVKEKPGEVLNIKKTVKSINVFLADNWDGKGGKVKAYVDYVQPEIGTDSLKDISDLLGSYSTFYGSDGSGRSKNIETGTRLINGTLLKPGEEVSANALMEPYTEENGYAMASSYESDKVVESMGGGICQVSSTLYNSIILAELEVTERYPHSMLVGYVEASKDAAIADDILDLVFKNNQKTAIYIEGFFSEGTVTFNIYGKETRKPGRTLEFVSEITSEKMPEGKRFLATEDPIGTYYVKTQAQAEIAAQLWKIVSQDGVEESRDIVNYSQYVPAKETIAVGTASDNEENANKIKAAIETQDEAHIQQVINEITG